MGEIVQEGEKVEQVFLVFCVVEYFFAAEAKDLFLLVSSGFIEVLEILDAKLFRIRANQLFVEPCLENHRLICDPETHWATLLSLCDWIIDDFFSRFKYCVDCRWVALLRL
jgi:hypothetical protein